MVHRIESHKCTQLASYSNEQCITYHHNGKHADNENKEQSMHSYVSFGSKAKCM